MTSFLLVAALASTFNLNCTGTAYHSSGVMGAKEGEHSFQVTYRVDLASGRYCQNACTTTSALAKVTDNLLVFQLEQKNEIDDTLVYANRENGSYYNRVRVFQPPTTYSIDMAAGSCLRAPFTGFPQRQF